MSRQQCLKKILWKVSQRHFCDEIFCLFFLFLFSVNWIFILNWKKWLLTIFQNSRSWWTCDPFCSSLIYFSDTSSFTVACPFFLEKDKLENTPTKSRITEDWLPIELHLQVIHLLVRKVWHVHWEAILVSLKWCYRISYQICIALSISQTIIYFIFNLNIN